MKKLLTESDVKGVTLNEITFEKEWEVWVLSFDHGTMVIDEDMIIDDPSYYDNDCLLDLGIMSREEYTEKQSVIRQADMKAQKEHRRQQWVKLNAEFANGTI